MQTGKRKMTKNKQTHCATGKKYAQDTINTVNWSFCAVVY